MMNSDDIRKLLERPDLTGAVKLPAGEFEGPFKINRACIVAGNNTTLWTRQGPVLEVASRGVVLKNMQIEVTGDSENDTAVVCRASDTRFENVTVYGQLSGAGSEDGCWGLPKVLAPGKIPADKPISMLAEIYTPTAADITVNISGITVTPTHVEAGVNVLRFDVEAMSSGTVIYGDIEVRSAVIRRIFLSMTAESGIIAADGQYLYRLPENFGSAPAPKAYSEPAALPRSFGNGAASAPYSGSTAPMVNRAHDAAAANVLNNGRLTKGQRISVNDILGSEITAELFWSSMEVPLDIDAYVFLLNEDNKAENDGDLVFFGNTSGAEGAVMYSDDGRHRIMRIDLDKVPRAVQRISLAYSIYGDDPANNFSQLKGGCVMFRSGGKTAEFPLNGLFMETTVVAAELYRRGDIWKICAVGQGYHDGLRRLCESFGLNIID